MKCPHYPTVWKKDPKHWDLSPKPSDHRTMKILYKNLEICISLLCLFGVDLFTSSSFWNFSPNHQILDRIMKIFFKEIRDGYFANGVYA